MSQSLEDLIEAAVISWLGNTQTHGKSFSGYTLTTEGDLATIALPAITVKANREAEEIGAGVYRFGVDVTLHQQPFDSADSTRDTAWDDLVDVLTWDTLASKLAVTNALATYAVLHDRDTERTVDEMHHAARYSFSCWSYRLVTP